MLSLIIPIHNEAILLEELLQQSVAVLDSITDDFEVICVDDGSTDESLTILKDLKSREARIKVVILSRNFGHPAAFTAGMNFAKGDYIALMDGDLQDPPKYLKPMYELLINNNLDIIHGRRIHRNEPFLRRQLIQFFHKIFKRFSNIEYVGDSGNFSIMTKRAMQALLSMHEKNRYLPGLRFYIGFNADFFDYKRAERAKGETKMSYLKLINLAFDAIFSFSNLPIKICLYLGILGIVIFSFGLVYTLFSKLTGIAPLGWSSLLLSIYFLGSVQLAFLGILGEYIYRMYRELQNRPIYFIKGFIE